MTTFCIDFYESYLSMLPTQPFPRAYQEMYILRVCGFLYGDTVYVKNANVLRFINIFRCITKTALYVMLKNLTNIRNKLFIHPLFYKCLTNIGISQIVDIWAFSVVTVFGPWGETHMHCHEVWLKVSNIFIFFSSFWELHIWEIASMQACCA
jgi:hypothetical protein